QASRRGPLRLRILGLRGTGASSTYRGYRKQALYVLWRLLTDADGESRAYRPEGDEDLAIFDGAGHLTNKQWYVDAAIHPCPAARAPPGASVGPPRPSRDTGALASGDTATGLGAGSPSGDRSHFDAAQTHEQDSVGTPTQAVARPRLLRPTRSARFC